MDTKTELRIETVVYVTRNSGDDSEVLLIYRDKSPNPGIWVPLGETVKFDESPYENAVKAAQESGLTAKKIEFRGLVTEVSPKIQWHLFLYEVKEYEGEALEKIPAGQLKWVKINDIQNLKMPAADGVMGPEILVKKNPFFEAKMYFTEDMKLLKTETHD
ncbi:NUDIX domain-containing protein [Candidatus Woesebacteria bacterium]|nr:NUDIX domain-containing protein [Candidatus Woesebacteria bacterium]